MKIWLSRAMDPLERNESANITFVAEGEKVPDSCILLCVLKMLGFVLVVHCSRIATVCLPVVYLAHAWHKFIRQAVFSDLPNPINKLHTYFDLN